jgi:hypothetical protein
LAKLWSQTRDGIVIHWRRNKRAVELARKFATKCGIISPVARAVNGLGLVYKGPSPHMNLVRFPRNISCASASEVSPVIPCRPLLPSLDSEPCHLTTSPFNLALVKEYQYLTPSESIFSFRAAMSMRETKGVPCHSSCCVSSCVINSPFFAVASRNSPSNLPLCNKDPSR